MPPANATTVENAIAGTIPTRSPSLPMTAAWTDPARPAVTDSATASPAPLDTVLKLYARRVADGGSGMVRVLVLYEVAPPSDRYAQHVELCRKVESATFRHGAIFGTPTGDEPEYGYYAEFEFPDRDAFKAAASSEELGATGKDSMAMGIPFKVFFASVE